MKKPVAYILTGLPGCGKTTWINNQDWFTSRYKILSYDSYLQELGLVNGISMTEATEVPQNLIFAELLDDINHAVEKNKNIVIDHYNISKSNRNLILSLLNDYTKIGVCFKEKDPYILHERVKTRGGYRIPLRLIHQLSDSYEYPSLSEGFDDIWYSN